MPRFNLQPFEYFGPNAGLVNEVVQFTIESPLLYATSCPAELDVLVVDCAPQDGLNAGINGIPYDSIPVDQFTYRDIRSEWDADTIPALDNHKDAMNIISRWFVGDMSVYHYLLRKLNDDEYIANWIVGDLVDIAISRAAFADKSPYELLFKIYKAGGWPVGWADMNYPDGRPMAVFPGYKKTTISR